MDRIRRLSGRWLALALALAGCSDSTGPTATPSEIAMRVYVDADGSGDFSSVDVPLAGVDVTLSATGSELALDATTDAEGRAVFADVPPGSYRASLSATAPDGTVLATARQPTLVAPFGGRTLTSEFRFVFIPGSIEGVLFRDDNANGAFDEESETAAAGVPVTLYAGEAAEGEALAETTTDASGAFAFDRLRPGTYTIQFTPFPTMEIVGGGAQTFTVGADAPTEAAVRFTGEVLSPIADARAAASDGSVVAVRGVVVSQPSFSDELFIQDGTAGIQVYAADANVRDLDLARGDSVLVVGTAGIRFGEVQISSVTELRVEGSGPAPAPQTASATQINAGELQGELVQIAGATVTGVDTLSFDNQFVTLVDAEGNEFGVYADSRTGVTPGHWIVGSTYNVTGVVGYDSRYAYPNRIEVRDTDDVEAAGVTTIAEARTLDGETVVIEGVVTVDVGAFGSSSFYIQDATAGIAIYEPDAPALSIGERVRVIGPVGAFNDEVQIANATEVTVIGTGTVDTTTLSIAQINAGAHQGEVATVESVTVASVEVVNSFGTQEVTVVDAAGDTLVVYVDNRTGITEADWTVGNAYDVTGIVSRYRSTFELKPRRPADVQPAS